MRGLCTGTGGIGLAWHVLYLAVMGVLGLAATSRRLAGLLLP
jgi:hypothetical protein